MDSSNSNCAQILSKLFKAIQDLNSPLVPSPTPFSGHRSSIQINKFFQNFEKYASSIYGSCPDSWLIVLPSFLQGEAKAIVIAFGPNSDYTTVKEKLIEEFASRTLVCNQYADFFSASCGPDESLVCFSIRLETLAKCFLKESSDARDVLVKSKFLSSLSTVMIQQLNVLLGHLDNPSLDQIVRLATILKDQSKLTEPSNNDPIDLCAQSAYCGSSPLNSKTENSSSVHSVGARLIKRRETEKLKSPDDAKAKILDFEHSCVKNKAPLKSNKADHSVKVANNEINLSKLPNLALNSKLHLILKHQNCDTKLNLLKVHLERGKPILCNSLGRKLGKYRKYMNQIWLDEAGLLTFRDHDHEVPLISGSQLTQLVSSSHRTLNHAGSGQILEALKIRYFHPSLTAAVRRTVAQCSVCKRHRTDSTALPGEQEPARLCSNHGHPLTRVGPTCTRKKPSRSCKTVSLSKHCENVGICWDALTKFPWQPSEQRRSATLKPHASESVLPDDLSGILGSWDLESEEIDEHLSSVPAGEDDRLLEDDQLLKADNFLLDISGFLQEYQQLDQLYTSEVMLTEASGRDDPVLTCLGWPPPVQPVGSRTPSVA